MRRAAQAVGLVALGFGCRPEPIEAPADPGSAAALSGDTEASAPRAEPEPETASDATAEEPERGALDAPTRAEFEAWNRKDPATEKHLYKWDKANLAAMLSYWRDLECMHAQINARAQATLGSKPSPASWQKAKRANVEFADRWQKRMFADNPRILEKSKFMGRFLEAHELVMRGIPRAWDSGDQIERDKAVAHWLIVQAKVAKYATRLGGTVVPYDGSNAAHVRDCRSRLKRKP